MGVENAQTFLKWQGIPAAVAVKVTGFALASSGGEPNSLQTGLGKIKGPGLAGMVAAESRRPNQWSTAKQKISGPLPARNKQNLARMW